MTGGLRTAMKRFLALKSAGGSGACPRKASKQNERDLDKEGIARGREIQRGPAAVATLRATSSRAFRAPRRTLRGCSRRTRGRRGRTGASACSARACETGETSTATHQDDGRDRHRDPERDAADGEDLLDGPRGERVVCARGGRQEGVRVSALQAVIQQRPAGQYSLSGSVIRASAATRCLTPSVSVLPQ